jgi:hypothetical protein
LPHPLNPEGKTSRLPGKDVSPKKYRIRIKIALLDDVDYSIANTLTEFFWRRNQDKRKDTEEIQPLLSRIKIGHQATFFKGKRNYLRLNVKPVTLAARWVTQGEYISYYFANPPQVKGINFAEFEMEEKVKSMDWLGSAKKIVKKRNRNSIRGLVESTKFWPVDSKTINSLRKMMDIDELEDWEKVIWIHHWVRSNIHGYPGPSKRWSVEKTLTFKKGNCWEVSDLFVTLCRSYEIPARQLGGWLYQKGKINAGHAWAEVFLRDYGWMPIDALRKSLTIPDYYIPYFATDDGKLPVVYLSKPKVLTE